MTRLEEVRAEIALAWLDAHPEGGNAKDVRAAALPMCHTATVQKLMGVLRMRCDVVAIGAGAHLRYAAPRHLDAATAYREQVCVGKSTERRRAIAATKARKAIAEQGLTPRPHGTAAEVAHQPIVSKWPNPVKTGPSSVFDLAEAT